MSAMEVSTPEAGDLVEVGKLEIGGVIDGDAPVTSLNFHANGEYLVSASRDGKCAQPVMQCYKRIPATTRSVVIVVWITCLIEPP